MWIAEVLRFVCAIFRFAGWVKGVAGLGLSAVALALLAATLGLREAIALMGVPTIVSNVWQFLATGDARAGCRVGKLGYRRGLRHTTDWAREIAFGGPIRIDLYLIAPFAKMLTKRA